MIVSLRNIQSADEVFLKPDQLVGEYKKMGEDGHQFMDQLRQYADLWGNRNGKVEDITTEGIKEAEAFVAKAEEFLEMLSKNKILSDEFGFKPPVKNKQLSRQEAVDFLLGTSWILRARIASKQCTNCAIDLQNAEFNARYAEQIRNRKEIWPSKPQHPANI